MRALAQARLDRLAIAIRLANADLRSCINAICSLLLGGGRDRKYVHAERVYRIGTSCVIFLVGLDVPYVEVAWE